MANFKTRARTLDLLGRQQIAGIPTAINELLKNAHDAYADKVDIDYFRKENFLVLRDDGVGMSKKDFESRWLTLGTESKFLSKKMSPPPVDNTKPLRPSMGEKGIGRLAIASIGKQVLILSKRENHKIVGALINWQIFELPGLNLEDIVVPVREFNSLPNLNDINEMKKELLDSVSVLLNQGDIDDEEAKSISSTILSFKLSPKELDKKLIGDYSINDNRGTFFYISNVDDILNADIDGRKNNKDATKIEKMLIGFHNTMTPDHPSPVLNILFRDYRGEDDTYFSIIDQEHFFTPEDFELADHHIQGEFDKFGQFKGMVKVYRDKNFDHIVNWNANNFKETQCGAFSINLAYVQGTKAETVIDPENFSRILAKADKFGGLYIYKDNIRILPYGDSDFDYLDIEKNRSKRISTYFFSYRRMFGVVNIHQKENFKLKEKAGREGFIENKAFRQLQDILKNFFTQLAADFFRDDKTAGPKAEAWKTKRQELQSAHKALERRDKQIKIRKEKFENSVNEFFINLNNEVFKKEVESILEKSEIQFGAVYSIKGHDDASQKVLDIESDIRLELTNYKKKISISQPRGFVIKKSMKVDYETYLSEINTLEYKLFVPAFNRIDSLVEKTVDTLNLEISKRKRLEKAVDFISTEAKKINQKKQSDLSSSVSDITKRVKELTNDLMIDLDNKIRGVKDDFKNLNLSQGSDIDIVTKRKELENDINSVSDRNAIIFDSIIRQLESVYWERDADDHIITNEEITNAIGEELDDLRTRVQSDIELSQLGLAVGVIHHEFSSTIKTVRAGLKDLKAWSDVNEDLEGVYKNIKISFEHLDGYLNLFTPLNRRLNRNREEIKALEIKTFLLDLFKTRLTRHNIKFKHTKGFSKSKLFGFRSTFYPVFVNLLDNAIYWLNNSPVKEKIILLHSDLEGNVFISNNGISIPVQDNYKIFDLGFTRKENGRGMGLHISKEVLNAEFYDIYLDVPREDYSVTFKIEKLKKENNE
ncbi:ATP-binding protein [Wenyingzhuangia sp. IMCC45533]